MPVAVQVKLLRVLQERRVQPVGGRDVPVDVRLISATNVDLDAAVAHGRFREDLLYRLNTVVIDLPPLRQRDGDVRLLVDYFNRRAAAEYHADAPHYPSESLDLLESLAWPGNVRQLENFVRRAVISCNGAKVSPDYIASVLKLGASSRPHASLEAFIQPRLEVESGPEEGSRHAEIMATFEAELLRLAYDRTGRNKSHTAQLLGIGRHTLRRKLRQYGIETPSVGANGAQVDS